jgi:hypothetical protein
MMITSLPIVTQCCLLRNEVAKLLLVNPDAVNIEATDLHPYYLFTYQVEIVKQLSAPANGNTRLGTSNSQYLVDDHGLFQWHRPNYLTQSK